ncbi:MAG TPA: bifunctional 5,10-methylenetetrahydrofolate dehydrogenase/5,10-methenyltetrahydrofolate cyclohydrolase [Ktedonobacterales bacterium]|jgi:methylenetetrahydrofolate dehydrogenase (NADP+)/methenyltetrahydrofolate cyclohydrolase
MPATLLDGRALSAQIKIELQARARAYHAARGHLARLALVIAGAHPAARLYSDQVARSCAEIGLECISHTFPFRVGEEELRQAVGNLSADPLLQGIVVLLPLPAHIQQRRVTEVIAPEKDVDGLGPRNAGNMMLGFPSFVPSTASAVRELLRASNIPLAGQHAVIVGRSNVGGKPIALLMLHQHATITICHSQTPNLAEITRTADILVASAGRPKLITAEMVKPGAVVLDAGINDVDGRIVGDVEFAGVSTIAASITPVPGGLGPLTNLMLIRHTLMGPEVE